MSDQHLRPGTPGYAAAIAALLAKAQAINPRFRLATPDERAYGDPQHLYSFSGSDGCMVAPIFVLDEAAPGPGTTQGHTGRQPEIPCPTCAGFADCDGLHD